MSSPFWISLEVTFIAFVLDVVVSVLLAWAMYSCRNFLVRSLFDGLFSLPMILPPTVIGFLLLMGVGRNTALGSFLESTFGFSFAFTRAGAVLAGFAVSFPLLYRALLGGFDAADKSQVQAAKTLGFSNFQILWHVLLPAAKTSLISGSILACARALGEYGATAMLAGNIPGQTRTLPLAVYSAVSAGNMDLAMQYAIILILLSLAAIIALNGILAWQGRKANHAQSKY